MKGQKEALKMMKKEGKGRMPLVIIRALCIKEISLVPLVMTKAHWVNIKSMNKTRIHSFRMKILTMNKLLETKEDQKRTLEEIQMQIEVKRQNGLNKKMPNW